MAAEPDPVTITCADEAAAIRLGHDLALALRGGDLVLLNGDLGAGKTFLARALIRAAATDPALEVPSPTFTLSQTYDGMGFGQLTHMDLYRLEHPSEVQELGLDQALMDGAVLVEWPQNGGLEPDESHHGHETLTVSISAHENDHRTFTISGTAGVFGRVQRSLSIRQFLDGNCMERAGRHHLTGDASARAYETIVPQDGTASVILMNAPAQPDGPPIRDGKPYSQIARLAEDMRAFAGVDAMLADAGLKVPAILAYDLEAGLLLIENLGQGTIIDANRQPIPVRYEAAIETLVHMHGREWPDRAALPDGTQHHIPPYDHEAMAIEVDLLPQWYAPFAAGSALSDEDYRSFIAIWQRLIDRAQQQEPTLVLRDYHSPNIIWREGESGLARTGLIDFQDAVMGPAAYDVASLVQDARVDMPAELEATLTNHYCDLRAKVGEFDEAAFRETLAIMAAQRATKILGIFVRLSKRDGKHQYLDHLPRIEAYLERACRHPVLAEIKRWKDTVLAR